MFSIGNKLLSSSVSQMKEPVSRLDTLAACPRATVQHNNPIFAISSCGLKYKSALWPWSLVAHAALLPPYCPLL